MQKKDEQIIAKLRENSRRSYSDIGKDLCIPTSTVFDKVTRLKKTGLITKCTVLMDYLKAGYGYIVNLVVRVNKNDKSDFITFLKQQNNINNLFEADDGFVFVMDCVHRNMREYVSFREKIKSNYNILEIKENVVLDYIKRESFMSN
ncbi:Lrp/AsnC family transcriptional regulator [Nanoarchaeota archaeon]